MEHHLLQQTITEYGCAVVTETVVGDNLLAMSSLALGEAILFVGELPETSAMHLYQPGSGEDPASLTAFNRREPLASRAL